LKIIWWERKSLPTPPHASPQIFSENGDYLAIGAYNGYPVAIKELYPILMSELKFNWWDHINIQSIHPNIVKCYGAVVMLYKTRKMFFGDLL